MSYYFYWEWTDAQDITLFFNIVTRVKAKAIDVIFPEADSESDEE